MSEELTRIEQDFINLDRGLTLLNADTSARQLVREIERSRKADEPSPHTMAIRAGLAADAVERVERAKVLLTDLSQKLTALQQEQLKNL
jgi:outer membrane PBP1 activator LpoA protein